MKTRAIFIIFSLFFSGVALSEKGASETDNGRYQIFFGKFKVADTFLVDTKTGKVWGLIRYTNIKNTPRVWLYQERIDSKKDRVQWEMKQELSE